MDPIHINSLYLRIEPGKRFCKYLTCATMCAYSQQYAIISVLRCSPFNSFGTHLSKMDPDDVWKIKNINTLHFLPFSLTFFFSDLYVLICQIIIIIIIDFVPILLLIPTLEVAYQSQLLSIHSVQNG